MSKNNNKKPEVNEASDIQTVESYPIESRYKGSILIPKILLEKAIQDNVETDTIYSSKRTGKDNAKITDYLVLDFSKTNNCVILKHQNLVVKTKVKTIVGKSGVKAKVQITSNNSSKFCSNCGASVQGKFCSGCGTKF